MDLILLVIGSLLIYWIGSVLIRSYYQVKREQRDAVVKYLNNIIHQVDVVKHYDVEYWYDADSGQFLGQGTTISDVVDVLKSRFPDHVFLIKDVGIFCAKTDWQILPFEQMRQIDLLSSERK